MLRMFARGRTRALSDVVQQAMWSGEREIGSCVCEGSELGKDKSEGCRCTKMESSHMQAS